MSTVKELRQKAATMELQGVDFVDHHGHIVDDNHKAKRAVFTFIDGEQLVLKAKHFPKIWKMKFHLRPARDDA